MAKKDSKKKAAEVGKGILGNWIVRNLLLAALLVVGLLLAAQVGLSLVTRHNRTVTVPDFTNMTVAEAHEAARAGHVGVKVTDSVFVRRLGAGVVYRQSPKAGATVKKGRSIQDIATNNVLRQTVRGRNVRAGDLVVSGSDVDLTLGLSSDERPTVVPRVIGQKYISAVDALHDRYLNVGRVRFDSGIRTYADSVNAVVYQQDGLGQTRTYGSSINLYLTLDPEKIPAE